MENISYLKTDIKGGLWKQRQDITREKTVYAVYDRFKETGRIDAFKCNWKEGNENKPHYFWDSDVAKWIEGVAYLTAKKREPKLEKMADEIIDDIEKNQGKDGYFNIYFTVVAPNERFTVRNKHELYCAGHLMEAACAYYEATGKRKMLDCMCRYADYIEKRFVIQKDTAFISPGHEEIELALVRLYKCTGEKRYLALSEFFVNERGTEEDKHHMGGMDYNQSHMPVRQQKTAEGHSVRALYLYSGMADVAYETKDEELKKACETLFDDIVKRKMYITGGVGSSAKGERFTIPYDLSNILAYTESCASIALVIFAERMLKFGADSKYSDVIEKVIYNGFLSSVSLDGTSFFYENPLEILPQLHKRETYTENQSRNLYLAPMLRSKVFDCSCCPPNILRFLAEIGNIFYSDDGETVYVNQFAESETKFKRGDKELTLKQETVFPENSKIKLTMMGGNGKIAVRIPEWSDLKEYKTEKGYAYFELKENESIEIDLRMKIKFIEARPCAIFDCGRYAIEKGPVIYCMEGVDNGVNIRDIRIDSNAEFEEGYDSELEVPTLAIRAYRRKVNENTPLYRERTVKKEDFEKIKAKLIPYYAFSNRGETEMQVWNYVI